MQTRQKLVPPLSKEEEVRLIRNWRDKKDSKSLEQLIQGNVPLVLMEVSRQRHRARRVGVEWEDLQAEAMEALFVAATKWRFNGKNTFYAYYIRIVRQRVSQMLVLAGLPVSLGGEHSRKAYMALPAFLKGLNLSYGDYIRPSVIEQAAIHFQTSEVAIRELISLLRRWGHHQSLESKLERPNGEEWLAARMPSDWYEGQEWLLNPEDLFLQKEGASKEGEENEVIDYRRDKFREWVTIVPRVEYGILTLRYILPSALGAYRPAEWKTVIASKNLQPYNLSVDDAQAHENACIIRMKKFAAGDFSLADPLTLEDQQTAVSLDELRQQAGDRWQWWLFLLKKKELSVLRQRWFTAYLPPLPFPNFCKGHISLKVRGGAAGLKMDVEEGKLHEENALKRLGMFAQGNFSQADYTTLVERLPENIVRRYFDSLSGRGTAKYAISARLLSGRDVRTNPDGSSYTVFGSIREFAKNRYKSICAENDGRKLTENEAYQYALDLYERECSRLIHYALSGGFVFPHMDAEAAASIKILTAFQKHEDLREIVSLNRRASEIGEQEKAEVRAKLNLVELGSKLTVDERMLLHRMLKLHSEGMSAYDISSTLRGETGWHPTKLQQFFLLHTTPAQRKLAKENGVKD